MESYIPLVKAIIISSMFSWGTSSVVITDQYILKENNYVNKTIGNEVKEYQVYDLKKDVVYLIDYNMNFRVLANAEIFARNELERSKDTSEYKIVKTTISKEKLDGYKCKVELRDKKWTGYYLDGVRLTRYTDVSYFAKIPWLDKTLDTKGKREFAGFERQEYSPFHYLINEFVQVGEQRVTDIALQIIEKSEVDTTLIHTLLSLPIKEN